MLTIIIIKPIMYHFLDTNIFRYNIKLWSAGRGWERRVVVLQILLQSSGQTLTSPSGAPNNPTQGEFLGNVAKNKDKTVNSVQNQFKKNIYFKKRENIMILRGERILIERCGGCNWIDDAAKPVLHKL